MVLSMAVSAAETCQEIWVHPLSLPRSLCLVIDGRILVLMGKAVIIILSR